MAITNASLADGDLPLEDLIVESAKASRGSPLRRSTYPRQRAADRMTNTMGSWPDFDLCPYILLNLFLSMHAGVQAAALVIAATRHV